MDVREFEDLIDQLGEDLSSWPEAQRLAAAELLASSVEARGIYDDARTIREALASPPVRAPAGLADRIVAAARELKPDVATPTAEHETASDFDGAEPAGKVLPVLLLAFFVWLLLAMPKTAPCDDQAATRICAVV